jgi:hypothetical protein
MALIGEYICMRRELRDIPITTKGFGVTPTSPPPTTPSSPTYSPAPSSPFASRWGKSSDDGVVGGFSGVVGVSGGIPMSDLVGIPVLQIGGEDRGGSIGGSGGVSEFTPRFGSGLGYSAQPPASVSIQVADHGGIS